MRRAAPLPFACMALALRWAGASPDTPGSDTCETDAAAMLQQKRSQHVQAEAVALRRSFSETTSSAEVSRLWATKVGRLRDPTSQMLEGQIWVKTRADLPTMSPNAHVEVYYNEVKLMGSSILSALSQYHSGLWLKVEDGSSKYDMAIELWADVGMFESLLPTSYGPDGPVFNNSGAVIIFSPKMHGEVREYWGGALSTKVARLTGGQLNEYFDLVLSEWLGSGAHNYYLFWSLAPNGHMTVEQKWHNIDNACDSFSMWSIWKIAAVGADLMTDGPIIRRNYVKVYTDGSPAVLVNGSDPGVAVFFKTLEYAVDKVKNASLTELVGDLASFFRRSKKFYYIDQRAGPNMFGEVTLEFPYITALNYHPMPLPLEWHTKCNKDTGSTCKWLSCNPWREATCSKAKCVCPPGSCVFTNSFGSLYCSDEV